MPKVERTYLILNASGGKLAGKGQQHGEEVEYSLPAGFLDLVPLADREAVDPSVRLHLIGKKRNVLADWPEGRKVKVTFELLPEEEPTDAK